MDAHEAKHFAACKVDDAFRSTRATIRNSLFNVAAALTALLALAGAGVRAEVIDIRWAAGGRFERVLTVAPGRVAEVCGSLASGARVAWQFEADAALEFNIHYHVAKDVIYPIAPASKVKAQDVLRVTQQQDYCWMWRNATDASVTLRLLMHKL